MLANLPPQFTLILIINSIQTLSRVGTRRIPSLDRTSTCTEENLDRFFFKKQYKAGHTRVSGHSITAKHIFQGILQKVNKNHICSKINFTNLAWSRTQMTFNRFVTQRTPPPSPPPRKLSPYQYPDFILACGQWIYSGFLP